MEQGFRNQIQADDLDAYDDSEYLPGDAPISKKISEKLQAEVDYWMESIEDDSPAEWREKVGARIDGIRKSALIVGYAGVEVDEPKIREPWKLRGETESEWRMSEEADRTRGMTFSEYADPNHPAYGA